MHSVQSVHVHPGATRHDISVARKHGAPATSMKHFSQTPWPSTVKYHVAPANHFKAISMKSTSVTPHVTVVHGIKRGV